MDEKTHRMHVILPEDLLWWLKEKAKRKSMTVSRVVRLELRKAYDREHIRAEEAYVREHPEVMQGDGRSAAESFPDDLSDDQQ